MSSASSRPTISSARVAEGRLGGRVDLDDVPVAVHRDDAVEGGVEDRRLARLALAHAALGAAALDELPDLRAQAAHRGQQLLVGREARGGEELHDAEHVPRRGGSGRRRRSAGPPASAARARGSGRGCSAASAIHAGPARLPHLAGHALAGREHHRAARLGEGGDGGGGALPGVRAAQGRAVGVGGDPQGAEVPRPAPRRWPPAGAGARRPRRASRPGRAPPRAPCAGARRRRIARCAWAWPKAKGTASLPHPVGRRTSPASWTGRAQGACWSPTTSSRRPMPVSRSTSPARPLPMTVTKRAPASRTRGVGAQQPGDGGGVGGGHAIEVGDHGHDQARAPAPLQRGVERLARGQVELATELDHRGHAHPVHGASEQRAGRSRDLVTVDAHG